MTSRLGTELVSLALDHFPRQPTTWESALEKASLGFEAFPLLSDPMIDLNQLTSIALSMNHDLHRVSYRQSSIHEVLAPKSLAGLTTDKSVGYWLRFLAPQRLRKRILVSGPLKKSNPQVVQWLEESVTDYICSG